MRNLDHSCLCASLPRCVVLGVGIWRRINLPGSGDLDSRLSAECLVTATSMPGEGLKSAVRLRGYSARSAADESRRAARHAGSAAAAHANTINVDAAMTTMS